MQSAGNFFHIRKICLVWSYVYLFQANTWWQNEDCAQKGCVVIYFWYFFKVRTKKTLELLLLRLDNWKFFYFNLMQGRKEENACMQVIFKLRNKSDVCGEKKVSGVHWEIGHCFLFLKVFSGKDRSWKSVSLVDFIMTLEGHLWLSVEHCVIVFIYLFIHLFALRYFHGRKATHYLSIWGNLYLWQH